MTDPVQAFAYAFCGTSPEGRKHLITPGDPIHLQWAPLAREAYRLAQTMPVLQAAQTLAQTHSSDFLGVGFRSPEDVAARWMPAFREMLEAAPKRARKAA